MLARSGVKRGPIPRFRQVQGPSANCAGSEHRRHDWLRQSLFINRVFITDECEDIVPPWLRFIRGVIDTPDMDLNVSREMLQKNPSVQKIGKALIKRILGELKKKKEKDPEAYEAFWDQFGMVLKEGLYEDIESRDKILEICLFRSARSGTLISLADYVAAMPDTQDKIYTLSAENPEQAETSPHLEGFRARDIDVLLMTDPVDEFWMQAVTEFEGKSFASATRGISDLDKVAPKSDGEKAEEKPDEDARNQEFAGLIAKVPVLVIWRNRADYRGWLLFWIFNWKSKESSHNLIIRFTYLSKFNEGFQDRH